MTRASGLSPLATGHQATLPVTIIAGQPKNTLDRCADGEGLYELADNQRNLKREILYRDHIVCQLRREVNEARTNVRKNKTDSHEAE